MLVIAGPTASGKSRLAVEAGEAFNGTVINADSMQVYRELPILTAQPADEDRQRVPHRLYGFLSASDPCSAGRWAGLAAAEIERALTEGSLPILVGGSGLYLKALLAGLSPVPEIPKGVRERAREMHTRLRGTAFHAKLRKRDAGMAARLSPRDSQRLMRAWEVVEATGRSLLDWHANGPVTVGIAARYGIILFDPPRSVLRDACDARFEQMMKTGALEEVRELERRRLASGLPAMRALGVPPLLRYLRGESSEEEAYAAAKTAIRRYAKRQSTWFRHQLTPSFVVSAQYSEGIREEIFAFIRLFLLTGTH